MPGWRIAAAAAALLGYALLGHWLMLNAAAEPWAVAALFGPLLVAVAGMGWHRRQWATLAACAGLLVLLAVIVCRVGGGYGALGLLAAVGQKRPVPYRSSRDLIRDRCSVEVMDPGSSLGGR